MLNEQEEALYWAGKAVDAHHNAFEIVQASAGKWQAAIAGFLGAYATIGFVVGPTTIASLPASDWKYVIVTLLGLAGLIGIVAVAFANQAGQGFPTVEGDLPLTGQEMADSALSGAKRSRRLLWWAMVCAVVAGALAITGSFLILANGLLASPAPTTVVVVTRTGSAYCGALETAPTTGRASLLPSGGSPIAVPKGASITVVSSCGVS